eukprot:CAMPEP_0116137488 /NCGR_PEP_ID=MMETSP0329-20121206/12273_1 /TAXON_ID=697910 /ORGANISM="Pseudo-nitzschia arenysensis, Strain B593" /LENGTH=642 /DNA_ID=CAMNT_0003632403 /DNA_START=284 /DNA_END=2212 /DNA_ORIENTATION=+
MDPNDPDDIPDFLDEEDFSYNNDDDDDGEEEREQYRLQQEKVNDELDNRKGRPWKDPWEISEEQWMASDTSSENLPDWNPSFVSRISQERLQVLSVEDGKGIPTLQQIVDLSLPHSDAELHPARKTKTYAAYRKSQHYAAVKDCVEKLAKERVEALLKEASASSEDRTSHQESVDALFEALQEEAKADESMDILSKHPSFASWVDRGLEEYLQAAQKEALQTSGSENSKEPESEETKEGESVVSTTTSFQENTPVFMDCYDPSEDSDSGEGPMVPKILSPLGPHRHGGPGRMVEEWELSAHSAAKRIMLRESTQKVASLLTEDSGSKIYVHGIQGVGKSALLASIVASARQSGSIVMYLPDGDRLRKNGFFITPSTHPDRIGTFDLQDLSQEALKQLVESHDAAKKMKDMVADRKTLELYFKETQFKKLDEFMEGKAKEDGSLGLVDLIEYSQENKKHAPMCYSVVVNRLMQQSEKKFMIVMDEFNCLFDKGHYFHMAYDEDVREAIPYHKINLFEPIMDAMGVFAKTVEEEEDSLEANSSNSTFDATNTAILVGTSESHAVARSVTTKLTDCAKRRDSVTVIEVPRFSSLEADHVLANFEATGVGKLRLDRGDTLMNPQEMEYLKMASGSIGQKLLDASIF